jgi:hypothetical protein
MPTVVCSDCHGQVSTSAPSCPHCGATQQVACPRCRSRSVGKVDGLKGRENLAGFILLLLAIIPGIAYYFDRTRLPYCSSCHHRVPSAR